jgi:predicted Zn-dependent protease
VVAILVALAAGLASPAASWAYVIRTTGSGTVVRWHDDEVRIRLDSSLATLCDGAEGVMVEALATWEDSGLLPARVVLEACDGAQAGFTGVDDHNDVLATTGAWPYSPTYAAVTITAYDATTGELLDADVVFDASRDWSCAAAPGPGQLDLLDTATHEFGHLLGLADSDDAAATMYPEAVPGRSDRRSLDGDDLDALVAAYGPPPALGRAPVGCAAAPAGERAPPVSLALAAVALIGLRRLWRRGLRHRVRSPRE